MRWIFHVEVPMCIFHTLDDFIIKKGWPVTPPSFTIVDTLLLWTLFVRPSGVYVETPHLFNIFSWECSILTLKQIKESQTSKHFYCPVARHPVPLPPRCPQNNCDISLKPLAHPSGWLITLVKFGSHFTKTKWSNHPEGKCWPIRTRYFVGVVANFPGPKSLGHLKCMDMRLLVVIWWDAWHEICQARATHVHSIILLLKLCNSILLKTHNTILLKTRCHDDINIWGSFSFQWDRSLMSWRVREREKKLNDPLEKYPRAREMKIKSKGLLRWSSQIKKRSVMSKSSPSPSTVFELCTY